ncbi:E3 ubiquitin-protein ligase HERC2 isoform X12 [Macaca mulatta]
MVENRYTVPGLRAKAWRGSPEWDPERCCLSPSPSCAGPGDQLHAAISHQVDPEFLGLGLGSVLLNSLKQTVVTLASSAGVLSTVQSAAQSVLQSGWSVLLPTAKERAEYSLLSCPVQDIEAKKEAQKEKEIDEQEANASTFHRSRTPLDKDLINTGICESSGKQCLPLVQLIQQLLRWSFALVAQAGVQCCNLTLPQPPPPRFK